MGSDQGMIVAADGHELLTKIPDILDSAVSKQFDNTTGISAYLFNFAMKSGLPSFPFFIVLRILFLPVRLTFMVTLAGLWHTHQ